MNIKNMFTIYPKGTYCDKNNNIQITTDDENVYKKVKNFFNINMKDKYKELNYFKQGDNISQDGYWLMFESMSNNDENFFESVEYLSKNLKIPFQTWA